MSRCRAVLSAVSALVWACLPACLSAQGGADAVPSAPVAVTAAQMQMAQGDDPGAEALSALAPGRSLRPVLRETWAMPDLRWDDHPRGPRWTSAVMGALRGHGAPLLEVVPRDIDAWCPAYPEADRGQRAAFWAGLVSTLAWHESTHRPDAVGGGGRWFGLVQIAPPTARWRNCEVGTGEALLNGPANLRCGVRIMAITVPRDGVVSEGMRGVAADWGPFHSSRKREDMRNWVRGQDYCTAPPSRALRPVMRPDRVGPLAAMAPGAEGPVVRPVLRPVR
ncbi:MAG: transglycosylase SLT domain-containing protein [Roseicyclus sp.]|jgi:hypothetical protein|nr:transglycosylase SLT domain-containing protein [Roseicyclus sp.]